MVDHFLRFWSFPANARHCTEEDALLMSTKRKIPAKPLVHDLRDGMGDRRLMEKYFLSPAQLQKVFRRLVDAGAIDEMELFMRSSLSDSAITKAFVQTDLAEHKFDELEPRRSPREVDPGAAIDITERPTNGIKGLGKILSKITGQTF